MTQHVYKTANASELANMTSEFEPLHQNIEKWEQSSGDSGGSGDLGSQALSIAPLVDTAAVLFIQREDSE